MHNNTQTHLQPRAWCHPPVLLALVLMLTALVLLGCHRPSDERTPAPRVVKLLRLQAAPTLQNLHWAAEVRARHVAPQAPRVGGKVLRRLVEPGQRVRAGQLLAELDAQDLAQAAAAAASSADAAAAQHTQARAHWQRMHNLHAEGFASAAQLDAARSALDAAAAQLQAARAQARVQSQQHSYAQLHADVSGVVVAVGASAGQVIAPGTPVVTIAADGPRDAVFAVSEQVRAQLHRGQEVHLQPWPTQTASSASAAQHWRAHVREVAASADAATRSFTVWAQIEDEKDGGSSSGTGAATPSLGTTLRAHMQLVPAELKRANEPTPRTPHSGVSGQVQADEGTHALAPGRTAAGSTFTIPTSALWQPSTGGTAVWVLDAASSSVRSRSVQVGAVRGDSVLISAGLHEGESIVATGAHVLSEGEKVLPWTDADEGHTTTREAQP